MYTNQANLQHTIEVQQKLFKQQLEKSCISAQLEKSCISTQLEKGFSGAQLDRGCVVGQLDKGFIGAQPYSSYQQSQAATAFSRRFDAASRMAGMATAGATAAVGTAAVPSAAVVAESTGSEWVVKRRSDGSRYVLRRPARNRLLRERARKLAEERCSMTTTDDDAVSELKAGRYWNREARRRHMDASRDRKSKRGLTNRNRNEGARSLGGAVEGASGSAEPRGAGSLRGQPIVENEAWKVISMMEDLKKLQENLAYGNDRDVTTRSSYSNRALLSVTTV